MAGLNTSRLFSQLLNTGLQTKDNPLYQVIYSLIGAVTGLEKDISASSSSSGGSTTIINNNIQQIIGDLGSSSDNESNTIIIPGPEGTQGIQGIQGPPGIDADDSEQFYFVINP